MSNGNTHKEIQLPTPEKCFWVNNGPILSDLNDLARALDEGMTDEQFKHHVDDSKNDFVKWVTEVLGDQSCAVLLSQTKTRKQAHESIVKCLERSK